MPASSLPVQTALASSLRISHAFVRLPETADIAHIPGIDEDRLGHQHQSFCRALAAAGVGLRALRRDIGADLAQTTVPLLLQDMAVLTEKTALLARFAPRSAQAGAEAIAAQLLSGSRDVVFLDEDAYLDAADVVRIDDRLFVGLSPRTSLSGAQALRQIADSEGLAVTLLDRFCDSAERMSDCVRPVGNNTILIREDLSRDFAFFTHRKIVFPQQERAAALAVNGLVLLAGAPSLARQVEAAGLSILPLETSELDKAGMSLHRLALCLPARGRDHVVDLSGWREWRAA